MSIGMTFEEFWCGSPKLAKFYLKAQELKLEQKNQEMWLQGLYNYNAVNTVLYNAFRKKGVKAEHYLKEPISLKPVSQEELNNKDIQKTIDSLNALKQRWDNGKHR